MKHLPLMLFIASALAGCATLSKDECLQGDWWKIGLADGSQGAPLARLAEHQKACAEFGVKINSQTWLSGRKQGLLSYCQPENAFQLGRRNSGHLAGDCEPFMQNAFLMEYARGQEIYRLERDVEDKKNDLGKLQERINKQDERINFLQKEAQRKDLTPDARKQIDDEWRKLQNDKRDNLQLQARLQDELRHLKRRVEYRLREFGR